MNTYLLKKEREQRGWSQSKVAEILSVSTRTVSRWEQGLALPYPYYRERLCALYSKNARELGIAPDGGEETSEEESQQPQLVAVAPVTPAFQHDPNMPEVLPDSHLLLGREELLSQVKQRLFDGDTLALTALNGLPGIGKTALAVALSTDLQVQSHFYDGVLWARLGPQPNVLNQITHWATLVGIAPSQVEDVNSPDAWARALSAAMGTRHMLLVIDDAWSIDDALVFQVGGLHCAHLLTTRLPQVAFAFAQEGAIMVPELEEADSLALLARFVPQLVQHEMKEARSLVRTVGGLPLALTLMGRHLAAQTFTGQSRRLQTALRQLLDAQRRLLTSIPTTLRERSPSLPENVPLSLRASISVSDQQLSVRAHNAFCALAVFPPKPDSFSEDMALVVGGEPVEFLDELWDFGLLESSGPGRYCLHQTIADYARVQGENVTAQRRLVDAALHYLLDHQQDYEALEVEFSNIQAALDLSVELAMSHELIDGALAIAPYMRVRGRYLLASQYLQAALQATLVQGDQRGQLAILQPLASFAELQGEYVQAEAYCQQGLLLARQLSLPEAEGVLLSTLGSIAHRRGDYALAQNSLTEGLQLARRMGDNERICSSLCYLGRIAHYRANYVQAEALYQEGLALARQHSYQDQECLLLTYLASVQREQSNYSLALQYCQEGLHLARPLRHYEHVSRLLEVAGNIEMSLGHYAPAETYFQEGLDLARSIGHRDEMCRLLATLGTMLTFPFQGKHVQAEQYLREGVELARTTRNLNIMPHLLVGLAGAVGSQGDYAQANAYYQEGFELARQQGAAWGTAAALVCWGLFRLASRQLDAAAETFREVLALHEAAPVEPQLIALTKYGQAQIAFAHGDVSAARRLGQESLAIFEAVQQQSRAAEVKRLLQSLPKDTGG